MIYKPKGRRYYMVKFMWQGQSIRKSTRATSARDARSIEAKLRSELARGNWGILTPKATPTLAEFLRRIRWTHARTAALFSVILIYSFAAYKRNEVWSSSEALWLDTVAKAPTKSRPHFHLARVFYDEGRFPEAAAQYEEAAKLSPQPDDALFVDWGLALDDAGKPAEALDKYNQAAKIHASAHVYSQIARTYGKQGKFTEALDALATAERLDPKFEMTYVYRGNVFLTQNNIAGATAEFNRALAINPANGPALEGLRVASNRH